MRPTISTEYLENDEAPSKPTYRTYYPENRAGLKYVLTDLLLSFQFKTPFENVTRDIELLNQCVNEELRGVNTQADFQIHILTSLFS